MRESEQSREVLLGIIESYLKQIRRNGKQYPSATLSDLEASIKSVLKRNGREYNDKEVN
jgi:hypothetical protein